jgi:hypothetical protein
MLGRHGRRAHHDLGAVRAQQRDLLLAHLVAHDEDAAVPALGGDDGKADAGVARRRLDDRAARLEQAVTLGGVDHRHRGTVLDRAARVRGLHLGDQIAREPAPDAREPDQRGVADEVEDRIRHVHLTGHRPRRYPAPP